MAELNRLIYQWTEAHIVRFRRHGMIGLVVLSLIIGFAQQSRAEWARTGNTIADGNGWSLKVERVPGGLRLPCDAVTAKGTPEGVLDLSGAVSDGSAIIEFSDHAFRSSKAGMLVSVTLPNTLVKIGENAFQGQTSLTHVAPFLPSSLKIIGNNVFYNLPLRQALDASSVTNLGFGCFRATRIPSILLGAGLRAIPNYAFEACKNLRSVQFPAKLETIGANAFSGCTNLYEMAPAFPPVRTIGNCAFLSVPASQALDLSSVTNLGQQAFRSAGITSVVFGAGLESIPSYAFEKCKALASATFIKDPASIGQNAFAGCTALRKITPAVYKTVQNLGENAFGGVPGSGLVGFLPAFMLHGTNDPSVNLSTNLPLLSIEPPTYRGMISTARRDAAVQFALMLNPKERSLTGKKVRMSVADAKGKVLASGEVVLRDASRWVPASLPLAADAQVGSYTLSAQMDGADTATASFKIVPVRPGQMFVDQDGVLLDEGKPFFPLGLYHVSASEIEAAAKTGINMVQFWEWDANPTNYARIKQAGIRVLHEDQFWGEVIHKYTKNPEYYNFETNRATRAKVEALRDDPSRALAMWYVADEPSASTLPHLKRIRNYWHELDEDHPTFLVSTGDSALEAAADVFAVDVYPIYFGNRRPLGVVGYYMDYARQGVRSRKPVIAVLQAFGDNERHHEKPEEVRCMSYLALTHGVKGVFWYCWKETGDRSGAEGAGNHPATIQVLTDVIAESKLFAPALLVPGNRMLKSDDEDGLIQAILCGNEEAGRFLIYVNSVYETSQSTLTVPELAGIELEPLFGGPSASVSQGKLNLKLPPLATGAFRVKAKQTP